MSDSFEADGYRLALEMILFIAGDTNQYPMRRLREVQRLATTALEEAWHQSNLSPTRRTER